MKIESYFKVMPEHTNWQPYNEKGNVIFGGVAMAKMDEQAAIAVSKLLFKSNTADYGVTWDSSFRFHRPVGSGDMIRWETRISDVEADNKGYNSTQIRSNHLEGRSIEVSVNGFLQTKTGEKHFSSGKFTFISKRGNHYVDHGLKNNHLLNVIGKTKQGEPIYSLPVENNKVY